MVVVLHTHTYGCVAVSAEHNCDDDGGFSNTVLRRLSVEGVYVVETSAIHNQSPVL